jgi:regulator of RNase E activity RraA
MLSNRDLSEAFRDLTTPLIADACVRLNIPLRVAPPGIRPILPESRLAGRVLPTRHYGSVDVFLEALGSPESGDALVIDNGGRLDEGCIGDLTVLRRGRMDWADSWWGLHRDAPG